MHTFVEQVINGLTGGALYALVTAGLALTVGVLGVVNFAHGDLFMLGAYLFFFLLVVLHLPYAVAGGLTVAGMAGVGALFNWAVIRPVINRRWQVQLVATLAASTVINNAVIWLVGSVPKTTPTTLSRTYLRFGGFQLSWQRVLIVAVTLLAFLGLYLFLKYTRMGKAMRAVSQNREAATAAGIRIGAVSLVTFLIGTALIGVGDVLVAPVYSVYPTMGVWLTLKGFAVLVVSGFGRVDWAIGAAFLLGIAESLGAGYIASSYTDAFAFVAMFLVLLVAPNGLFSRRARAGA